MRILLNKYRRLMIAITYLHHLLAIPSSHFARASVAMDLRKVPSWLPDLYIALMRLAIETCDGLRKSGYLCIETL